MLPLLATVVPLALLTSLRPVQLVQATSITTHRGIRDGFWFLLVQTAPYAIIGIASMGVLGSVALHWAARQLASDLVDGILGILLLAYGVFALLQLIQDRMAAAAAETPPPASITGQNLLLFGLFGNPANLIDVPLVIAMAQRIGVAPLPWVMRMAVFAGVLVVIMAPGWIPLLLARRVPSWDRLVQRISRLLDLVSTGAMIAGSILGGGFLLWLAFT